MKASNSKIQCYKSCRRLYQLKYQYGLTLAQTPEALADGLSYHAKVEALLQNGELILDSDIKTNAMIKAFKKYILPQLNAMATEVDFEYTTISGHKIVGRVDGLTKDGKIIEHKSTSMDIDAAYWAGLENNEQILTYCAAFYANDVIYTACKKPTIRLKKTETEEEFEERCTAWYDEDTDLKIGVRVLHRSDEEIEEFKQMQDATVSEMESVNLFYRNENHCMKWGRMCEFAPICKNYDPNQEYIEFIKREVNND